MIRWLTHILDIKNILGMQRVVYYTIRFVNWDGTLLQETQELAGTIPTYTGATPTRPNDAQYSYTFDTWQPAIAAATEDKTYTAQYTAIPLPIPQYPNNQVVLQAEDTTLQYYISRSGGTAIQITRMLNGHTDVQYVTANNVWRTLVDVEAGTDIILEGVGGDIVQVQTNDATFICPSNTVTDINTQLAFKILDFRNASALTTFTYAGSTNSLQALYGNSTNGAISYMQVSLIEQSTVSNGVLYINTAGYYAPQIITAAQAKGWSVVSI